MSTAQDMAKKRLQIRRNVRKAISQSERAILNAKTCPKIESADELHAALVALLSALELLRPII
jgi:uncharacterized protein (UPF0147 family)